MTLHVGMAGQREMKQGKGLSLLLILGDTVDFFKVHGDERNVRRLFTKFHYLTAEKCITTNGFFVTNTRMPIHFFFTNGKN